MNIDDFLNDIGVSMPKRITTPREYFAAGLKDFKAKGAAYGSVADGVGCQIETCDGIDGAAIVVTKKRLRRRKSDGSIHPGLIQVYLFNHSGMVPPSTVAHFDVETAEQFVNRMTEAIAEARKVQAKEKKGGAKQG